VNPIETMAQKQEDKKTPTKRNPNDTEDYDNLFLPPKDAKITKMRGELEEVELNGYGEKAEVGGLRLFRVRVKRNSYYPDTMPEFNHGTFVLQQGVDVGKREMNE
jgi:hypothetical protein